MFFSVHVTVFRIVLPEIYLRLNIPDTDGKVLRPTVNKISAEYFNRLLEVERKLKICTT